MVSVVQCRRTARHSNRALDFADLRLKHTNVIFSEVLFIAALTFMAGQSVMVFLIDVGILALPVDLEGLEARELYTEPFIVAIPDQHKLARRDSIRTEDLKGETVLLLEDGHCLRDQALEVCSRIGAQEKQDFRATSLETLRQMVAANVGITLLPVLAVKPPVARSSDVRLIEFRGHPPSRRIAMVWRRSSAMVPFLKRLAQVLRELPPGLLDAHLETFADAQPEPRKQKAGKTAGRRVER